MYIIISTQSKRQVVDITEEIEVKLKGDGVASVFVRHTTAAVTTADLDPGGTDQDYLDALSAMTPDGSWNHPHDPAHFPDHLWASILGSSMNIPFKDGKLQLGTWQRLILVELDGPRERELLINIL